MMKKPIFILIFLVCVFGIFYFWLTTSIATGLPVSAKFDWPDETANYFWINHYAQTGELTVAEPLNAVAQNQIHPRSFNVTPDGSLVPGSFLGLILFYGQLAKIFTPKLIIYFTPLLALLAVLAFYGIIRRIFDDKTALLSAILMLFNPAWWYYSVTSMLPNVVFVSLMIFSIYLLLKNISAGVRMSPDGTWGQAIGSGQNQQKISINQLLLSAFFLGLALSIRPADIVWVAIVFLFVLFYRQKQFSFLKLIIFLSVVSLVILPTLLQHKILYGGYFTTGYDQLEQVGEVACQSCQVFKALIFPFGFHPFLVGYNFWVHYLSRFWWLSLFAIMGGVIYLSKKSGAETKIFGFIILSIVVSAFLAIYYGSWQFSDQLTINLNTLGISYVRYWIPIHLLSLPFIASAVLWLSQLFARRLGPVVMILALSFIFYQSADLVLRSKADSILPVRQRIVSYKQAASKVFDLTEPDAVIVTVRKDKLFFPERRVIHTFDALSVNKDLAAILPPLVRVNPTYYYALGPEPVLELDHGLSLEPVGEVGREVLYKIVIDQN